MVDNLIRPANVTNPALLRALKSVQRDKFLPSNLAGLSYSETELIIQNDRTSINPWLLAKMIQSLNLNSTDNVLSLATGFGYSCALLSSLANFVVAVESCELAQEAQSRLIENGCDNMMMVLYRRCFGIAALPSSSEDSLEFVGLGSNLLVRF